MSLKSTKKSEKINTRNGDNISLLEDVILKLVEKKELGEIKILLDKAITKNDLVFISQIRKIFVELLYNSKISLSNFENTLNKALEYSDDLLDNKELKNILYTAQQRLSKLESVLHKKNKELAEARKENERKDKQIEKLRAETHDKITTTQEEPKIQTKAPNNELYANRPGTGRNRENAYEFFKRVYLDQGYTVYQYTLGGKNGIDKGLYEGLKGYCKTEKIKLAEILRPLKSKNDNDLLSSGLHKIDIEPKEIVRLALAAQRR